MSEAKLVPHVEQGNDDEEVTAASTWRGLGVLDLMQEGLQILGFDWRYLYVNRAAAEHGRRTKQELLCGTLLSVYPGVERSASFAALNRCMLERTTQCAETEFVFPDGTRRWFELRIEPVPEGILVLSIDIDRRRELEAGLALGQKMEAVGRLAGGIAHDFNNILTVIVHSTEFVVRALPKEHTGQTDLREVLNASERGAKMVRQLLALSKQQTRDARPLLVNDALTDLVPMLRRLVTETVAIELTLAPTNPSICIDQGHLTQLMLNLVANARDAIKTRGTVWISTAILDRDAVQAALPMSEKTGTDYVRIAVSDDGCGMDEATLKRVFEPYFTTKQPGKGTGLGLAAAHGMVRQNEGHIRVSSVLGQGTTFEVYFPRIVAEVDKRRPRSATPDIPGGDEVVLVVDDDPSVRTLCARTLSRLGYTVMQVENAIEALRFVSRYSGTIDLVLSDVSMPDMNGPALCRQLQAARPDLRVLLMTGYMNDEMRRAVDPSRLLTKPFSQSELAQRVRAALDPQRAD